ncbi:hypothetical protein PSYPI_36035, partial [Pseudomonas syringae pv. pisi str. 1704B]
MGFRGTQSADYLTARGFSLPGGTEPRRHTGGR